MKCKVCGAYNEDYLEYCEKCAAPLTADNESEKPEEVQQPENEQNKGQDYQSYVASTGETPPAWGFVKAPNWPKPEFDADTVSEEDIPQGYGARFNPRPANAPVQKVAANEGDEDFTNNVRMHKAKKPAALILKNGLRHQFERHDFDQNQIYQLGALELSTLSTRSVVAFLANH